MISSAPKNSPLGDYLSDLLAGKLIWNLKITHVQREKKWSSKPSLLCSMLIFQWCILPKIHIPSFGSSKKKTSRFCGCSLSVGFPPAHCVQVQTPHLRFEQDPSTIISCWSQGIVEGWMFVIGWFGWLFSTYILLALLDGLFLVYVGVLSSLQPFVSVSYQGLVVQVVVFVVAVVGNILVVTVLALTSLDWYVSLPFVSVSISLLTKKAKSQDFLVKT